MLMITPPPRFQDLQRGFTLGELTVVLAVVSSLSMGYITWKQDVLADRIVQNTADGIILIQEALYGYRMDPTHGYAWPAVINDLDPYLPHFAGGGRNGVGQPYRIEPPPPPVRPTDGLIVATEMLTDDQAQLVARRFPLTGAAVGKTVRVGVPVPGHEEAREAVLARDGAKDMLGALDMGGNNIGQAGSVDAVNMQSTMLTVTGNEISIGGRRLHRNDVKLLGELAALNCRDGAVRVEGRAATCVTSVTRCRMCARARNWAGGSYHNCRMASNAWGATGPVEEVCSGWSDAPRWGLSIWDDTDDSSGGCRYQFYTQCDGQPTGAPAPAIVNNLGDLTPPLAPTPPTKPCQWGGPVPIGQPCGVNPH